MAQQINLCARVERVVRPRFAARHLALALAAVALVGGALVASLVWNLGRSSATYQQTLAQQERDIQGVTAVLATARAGAGALDATLQQQLEASRQMLRQRSVLLAAVRDGAYQSGQGHSDRLQLLARSIPAKTWVTGVAADADRLEISGFTLEPASLNDWVAQLARSPVLQGLRLASVQVDKASPADGNGVVRGAGRPVWSFALASVRPPSAGMAGTASAPAGGARP